MKVVCLRHVPAFNTWSTVKFFLNRRMERHPGSPELLEEDTERTSPKAGTPYISSSEPEGDRVLRDLLHVTSCGDEQPLTSRAMCSSTV